MPIRGDFEALRELIEDIADAGSSSTLRDLSKQLAEEGLAQVADGFRDERDPYGNKWAPLTERKGRILRDTGRLANSFKRLQAGPDGFTLGSNVVYAGAHQDGATIERQGGFTARTRLGRFRRKDGGRGKAVRVAFGRATKYALPARLMVPDKRGLGPIWGAAFRKVAVDFVRKVLKR